MLKTFQIDYIRAIFNFVLAQNTGNEELFNDNDLSLFSFYEHLQTNEEVNRYVERYEDMVRQQNRTNQIGVGIVSSPSSSTLVNINSNFVSPFSWVFTLRTTLGNRDKMLCTMYDLIEKLKGKKVDVAQFKNGTLLPVGTLGQSSTSALKDYDYIGDIPLRELPTTLPNMLASLENKGLSMELNREYVFYAGKRSPIGGLSLYEVKATKLETGYSASKTYIENSDGFSKMKVSLGFGDIKLDEPITLNAKDFLTLTFDGDATLTTQKTMLGNDLVSFQISKDKILGANNFVFTRNFYELEPLESPSGNTVNSIQNQLRSNFFVSNSHNDSIAISLQYNFLYDTSIEFLNQLYMFGRYGNCGLNENGEITQNSITPNIIYIVREITSSWGVYTINEYKAKISGDVDISNTDYDVITISISLQLQGENN